MTDDNWRLYYDDLAGALSSLLEEDVEENLKDRERLIIFEERTFPILYPGGIYAELSNGELFPKIYTGGVKIDFCFRKEFFLRKSLDPERINSCFRKKFFLGESIGSEKLAGYLCSDEREKHYKKGRYRFFSNIMHPREILERTKFLKKTILSRDSRSKK
jgi:hypothetical protein